MVSSSPSHDVFVSHDLADHDIAEAVVNALESRGLSVAFVGEELNGDTIWDALTGSQSMVLVVPQSGRLNANSAVELGAAMALNVPIYAVIRDEYGRLPNQLTYASNHLKILPMDRLADLATHIAQGLERQDAPHAAKLN